jgi:glycosyltransferase involved in cell wall biosynthesis
MAKPAICYISSLSIHSSRWIDAFSQKGYKTSLITDKETWVASAPKSTQIFRLPALSKQNSHKRFIPNTLDLVRIIRKLNPDLIHLHALHYYAPAIFLSNHSYILTSWGLEVLELLESGFVEKTLAKMAATLARQITVDAECLKEIWTRNGIPDDKIDVIPFGVDINMFHPRISRNTIRKKLGIKSTDTQIISTRPFFNHHYNIECLINAIPLVLKSHKNVKFILKGTGPLEPYFRKLVEKLKIAEYVHFIGLVPHADVARYLVSSDIYVSTSFIDSTSVSLLEAMACGAAPVVTDILGNREWIQDGANGFLFPPRDSRALAEKIIQLIENPHLQELYSQRNYKIIREKADWQKCVSKMEAIYESLL